jgi:hypothetical protein
LGLTSTADINRPAPRRPTATSRPRLPRFPGPTWTPRPLPGAPYKRRLGRFGLGACRLCLSGSTGRRWSGVHGRPSNRRRPVGACCRRDALPNGSLMNQGGPDGPHAPPHGGRRLQPPGGAPARRAALGPRWTRTRSLRRERSGLRDGTPPARRPGQAEQTVTGAASVYRAGHGRASWRPRCRPAPQRAGRRADGMEGGDCLSRCR